MYKVSRDVEPKPMCRCHVITTEYPCDIPCEQEPVSRRSRCQCMEKEKDVVNGRLRLLSQSLYLDGIRIQAAPKYASNARAVLSRLCATPFSRARRRYAALSVDIRAVARRVCMARTTQTQATSSSRPMRSFASFGLVLALRCAFAWSACSRTLVT